MVQVVVGLGANVEREQNLCAALTQLQQHYGKLHISPAYESHAVDGEKAHNDDLNLSYLNLVVAFYVNDKDTSPEDLKRQLQDIENQQGRLRQSHEVSLDLDLLLYGDWLGEVMDSAVPHHDIGECAYVLRPLADLLPDQVHPVFKKTYRQLWEAFEAKESVWPVDFVWQKQLISTTGCLPII